LGVEEKVFINEQAMALVASGTLSILEEHAHIKDAISRVVVEIIKREWPQQWPTLMQELYALCSSGPTQTELVLLILLRLAEDVLIFQSVPHQRRHEIIQGLTSSFWQLFEYFISTMDQHFEAYVAKVNSLNDIIIRHRHSTFNFFAEEWAYARGFDRSIHPL
jgi:exportin-5